METILKAYKTKLRLNNKERGFMRRYAGTARYVYNWALADRKERYGAGNPTNYYEQKKRFNETKDEVCPWIREMPYTVTETAFRNLDRAYQNFFRRVKKGEKPGFPRFKSRHGRQSFGMNGAVVVERNHIRLPIVGWLRLAEKSYIPEGKYTTSTISRDNGNWFVSVLVEEPKPKPTNGNGKVLGIDLGIKSLAVCSDRTVLENPRVLAKYEKRLARLQRELSRRKRGGQNWKKTKAKIAKLHAKIRRTRHHVHHDFSHHVTDTSSVIVLEDLNVSGMVKNHSLAKAISDAGFGELRRQIQYKGKWRDVTIVLADRFFPSSKTCSHCGVIRDDLTLSERTFCCPDCGFEIDRDLNAARNLAALGEGVSNAGLPVKLR